MLRPPIWQLQPMQCSLPLITYIKMFSKFLALTRTYYFHDHILHQILYHVESSAFPSWDAEVILPWACALSTLSPSRGSGYALLQRCSNARRGHLSTQSWMQQADRPDQNQLPASWLFDPPRLLPLLEAYKKKSIFHLAQLRHAP